MTAPDTSSRKDQAVRGSLWTLVGYGGSQVLRLGSNLVLARLLFPEAFGLMALVNVFLHGLQMFSDVGIGPSIIQNKRGQEPAFLRTAWTIQIGRGIILWLATCALALPVAAFFAANDPMAGMLTVMLPVAGLTALISGFASTGVFLLNRKMALGRVTALELIPQLCSIAVMIGWAWIDRSVWALVAGGLAFSVVRVLLSHLWNPGPGDRPGWDRSARTELFSFGKWVFLSTLVTFLASHLDKLMLGRLLTMAELGVYSIGLTFARVAIHVSSRLSSVVIFPLLSRLQDEPRRLVDACLKARAPVLWLSSAVCAGFALGAPLFFGTLYDSRYADAGVISQWLALFTWTHVLVSSMDRIPLALGRPKVLFSANLLTTCAMILALPGYLILGLPGFILGMAAANLAAHVFLVSALPMRNRDMARQSALFSLGLLCYTAPLVLLLDHVRVTASPWTYALAVCCAAAPPLLLGAWKAWGTIRKR
ncbi:oligosaccharide flippase family protein [Desulfonatronum parangueonense]